MEKTMKRFVKIIASAILITAAFSAISDENSTDTYRANTDFVRDMLDSAKVGDQVESFEWERTTRYTVTGREKVGSEARVYLERRDGAGIMWPHHEKDPLRCGEKDHFCQNARLLK
jgi:hypothetical protein